MLEAAYLWRVLREVFRPGGGLIFHIIRTADGLNDFDSGIGRRIWMPHNKGQPLLQG